MNLTLDKIWDLEIAQYTYVAEHYKPGVNTVDDLKTEWLEKNGFADLECGCFFCQYTKDKGGAECELCPGKLVDPDFNCGHPDYKWDSKPVALLAEFKRLNAIRNKR